MKFVVVGLGSMGKRRIRLLKKIDYSIEIIGVDSDENRCISAKEEFNIEISQHLLKTLEKFTPDAVVVSSSPLSHSSIIKSCLEAKSHVFTELNLVNDGYVENVALSKKYNKILFLSSTFLYRKEIGYIQERVKQNTGKLNYIYHVGQYLPDWHPWEKIENYFVSDIKTNGCRELLAIELPWLIKTFGRIINIHVITNKKSDLNIAYNDNYMISLEHEDGTFGSLAVDIISRKAVRNLEIFGEKICLSWDGSPKGLKEYDYKNKKEILVSLYDTIDKQNDYASFIIENAYEKELRAFINEINGKLSARYTFEDDLETIKLIDYIEGEK